MQSARHRSYRCSYRVHAACAVWPSTEGDTAGRAEMWFGLVELAWKLAMTARIEINPSVMRGKPVIRNTRIPVELLLRKLAEGAEISELLDAYPRITREDVRACLEYAADAIAHEATYSLSSE